MASSNHSFVLCLNPVFHFVVGQTCMSFKDMTAAAAESICGPCAKVIENFQSFLTQNQWNSFEWNVWEVYWPDKKLKGLQKP